MKLLKLRGGYKFQVTDAEAKILTTTAVNKGINGVTILSRLDNMPVKEINVEYLGPVNEESLQYEEHIGINGIIYGKKDNEWYYLHYTGPFGKDEYKGLYAGVWGDADTVDVPYELNKDMSNRVWIKVPEYHEVAVLPADDFLKLQNTQEIKALLAPPPEHKLEYKSNLPAVISGIPVIMIGTEKRIERDRKREESRLWHDKQMREEEERREAELAEEEREKKESELTEVSLDTV
jgi:hypothetical protein